MQEAGKKFRYLVQFTSGQPTSDLTYTLYNQDGTVILTEVVPIIVGQLSEIIEIPGGSNALSKPLFEKMTLEWEYDTATEAIIDSVSYIIHLPIGFPVSEEGVRNLLGVDVEELPDEDVELFNGFMSFLKLVGSDVDLTAFIDSGDYDSYQITKAIEAATALALLSSLQIRLPRKYDSGTSSYERWNTIDWEGLAAELYGYLQIGVVIVLPDYELWPDLDIFVLSDRGPDQITGE